jgi:transposase, IS6 family
MTSPVVLVLDDMPLLRNSECRAALSVLADHSPAGRHGCTSPLREERRSPGTVALADRGWLETGRVTVLGPTSVFAGFRFPREVISVAVRWYLRYGLSYRDVEELLAERGVTVDHVTVYRWVQRFAPEFIEAARPCRHAPGDRWFVDETYLKVAGTWTYLYRVVDQYGQVIDVLLSARRDLAAARRFFARALRAGTATEVTTDRASFYPRVLDELVPSALHIAEQYANNPVQADHGRLKARLRPMRGLKRQRSARILAVMPSCRICGAANTTLPPMSPISTGYGGPSTTWQSPYDQRGSRVIMP